MRVSLATASLTTALLAAGCGEPLSPVAPTADALGTAAAPAWSHNGTLEVPFKGELEGTVTATPLSPGMANVLIDATGDGTQLGRFTLLGPHIVNFATRTGTGTFTFTAANGALLFASFTGQATGAPPVISIVEHATITGGTGRFAGATGSFIARRLFDQPAGRTTGTFEGTISSPGASQH